MVGSGYFPLKAGERRSLVLVGPCELLVRLVVPGGGSHGRGKWSVVEERGGGAAGWGAAAGVRGTRRQCTQGTPRLLLTPASRTSTLRPREKQEFLWPRSRCDLVAQSG